MIFEPVQVDQAAGLILAHNIVDATGRRRLRKGSVLSDADLSLLGQLGLNEVWVARLEAGDIGEDAAALQIAEALLAPSAALESNLEIVGPRTGRVNLRARRKGLAVVNAARVATINRASGVTFATLGPFAIAEPGRVVATVKILPYALPGEVIDQALIDLRECGAPAEPAVTVLPFLSSRVALVVSGTASGLERTVKGFESSLRNRLERFRVDLDAVLAVALPAPGGAIGAAVAEQVTGLDVGVHATVKPLAHTLRDAARNNDLVLLAGETAIQDRHDIAPRAIEAAGGSIICFGAPVDPGNLLLLGEIEGTTVLGVPGCARSPKPNIVDLLLPRILAGLRVTQADVAELGVGGLLDDVPERPLPRNLI